MRRRVLHLWFDAAVRRIKPVKTALRRFQQLEQRCSESLAARDTSGARERFMAHINRMAARLRADPNWKPPTPKQAEEIKQHFEEYFGVDANGTS